MTRYIACVTSDLNKTRDFMVGYRVSLGIDDPDEPWENVEGRMVQIGPVVNNIREDRGCFPTRAAALTAILDFINWSCVIRQADDGSMSVRRHGDKGAGKVLASRTKLGTFIAD